MSETTPFDQLIQEYLAPPLKDAGFKKSRITWNRRTGALVHVINAQKSLWNTRDSVSFTINIGIAVPDVYEILWGENLPRIVAEPCCLLRYRIGYLPGTRAESDRWWTLTSVSDVAPAGREIADLIAENCLPLLRRCRTLDDVLVLADETAQWSLGPDRLAYAILLFLIGQDEAGEARFAEFEADPRTSAWRSNVAEIRRRLRDCGRRR